MVVKNESAFTPAQVEELATENTSSERLPLSEYDLMYPSSSPGNIQAAIEDIAPSQSADEGKVETIVQTSPHLPINGSLEVVNQPLQLLATDSENKPLHPPRSPIMSKLDILTDNMISASPAVPVEESLTRASPSAVDIQLVIPAEADDVVLGFHMLDLHEVLSPWVPVSSTAPSVYVPPAVQQLIAAMKHQLEIECRARRRAEELYLEEMRKRIEMEEVIDKLQKECGQSAIQPPPSLDTAMRAASAHVSPELHGPRDGEARLTSIDITHPNVTTESSSA
ncbi:hypothetical protein DFH29DRAFT_352720 [Suillus ampliporus]|nr:hypothetical protein DFH29DRAFT_352720 [Suillus ampliporus]